MLESSSGQCHHGWSGVEPTVPARPRFASKLRRRRQIAIVPAVLSVAIALGVFGPSPLRWTALVLGIAISVAYWLFGQSLGGPFWASGATCFNAGPLYVLLAIALFPVAQRSAQEPDQTAALATAQTRTSIA